MRDLPTGTVTFLFTDVEGSTRLLREHGEGYAELLAEHHRLLRRAWAGHGGVEVGTEGDAFFVAFARASDALAAAVEAQAALAGGPVRVRMGLHTGEPLVTEEGYVGMDVHRAARIAAAGHGGQVLVSQATRDLAGADGLRDLGEHRLKDLSAPERLFQLGEGEFPPLKSLNQTNLPVQPNALVGRERELAEITAFLRNGTRLLTLTGAGGSGKTRLALHAAAELADVFADGIWFVPLAPVSDPALVESTVGQVLGLRGDVREELQGRRTLLLLDNFEHLLDAAPRVAELLQSASEVRILATSRERLAIATEQEYVVPTLPLDEAVALFTQRARRVKPRFDPDDHVAEIARRLDGLPLALELAAARVKVLTPAQIAERLGRGLDLLTGGGRDMPERQRTLRATIEWSYQLLEEDERSALARLGLFAGSFDVPLAERVAEVDLDALQSLVDKSLVRETAQSRFFLLGTVRQFAFERLEASSRVEELRRRQLNHLLELAERGGDVTGDAGIEWLDTVELMLADVRAALSWAVEREPVAAMRAVCLLRPYWTIRGVGREGQDWYERVLAYRDEAPRALVAELLASFGDALFFNGELDRSEGAIQESRELYLQLGDELAAARTLNMLASTLWARGDTETTLAMREEALAEFRRLGEDYYAARTLHYIGEELRDLGEYDRAREMLLESIASSEAAGSLSGAAASIHSLADMELDLRRLDDAETLYERSLELSRRVKEGSVFAYCFAGQAAVAALRGNASDSGRLWGRAEASEERVGRRMLDFERTRYEQILTPLAGNPEFQRAYEGGRREVEATID